MNGRELILGVWMLWLVATTRGEVWTLERALEYAALHNPDARIAQQRIVAAQAGLEQANSFFWPKLQLQSGYTRTDNPMLAFGSILNQRAFNPNLNFNNVPETDDINVRGLVTAPLYAGGRNTAERDAAKSNWQAAGFEESAVRNNLQYEVARAFHTIVKTREFVRSAQSTVSSLETNLVVAQRRIDGGTLLKSDGLDIEVRLAQAREDLVRARNSQALSQRALWNLLGLEGESEFVVADSAPNLTAPENTVPDRAELAAARKRLAAAEARVRSSKSGYKPKVSAFGSLDYDYGPITHGDNGSYAAGVIAQWDLWDGFSTRSKVSEAQANLEALREEERKLRLEIELELEQARLNLHAAAERLATTEKMVLQATESLRLTQNRFEQGLALSTQILDSESALLAARVRRADAESDERIAIGALRKALGLPQMDQPRSANGL